MGSPADTLVSKHPTRIAQLKGPVLQYLKERAGELSYNGTDQDLYMAVFHPVSRRVPINTEMSSLIKKQNPGIKTVRDYVSKVNAQKYYPDLTSQEWTALKNVSGKLGVSWESLFKLINFESGWDPKARNKISGARGLIQFMPRTAKGMGYKATLGIGTIILILAGGYFAGKKLKLI